VCVLLIAIIRNNNSLHQQ